MSSLCPENLLSSFAQVIEFLGGCYIEELRNYSLAEALVSVNVFSLLRIHVTDYFLVMIHDIINSAAESVWWSYESPPFCELLPSN